jgi:ferredoxin-type protein NapH
VIGAPWTVSLWGLEIYDPLASASLLIAHGASLKLLWGALPALALILLLGRFYCGWICPYVPLVAVSNSARWVLTRLGIPLLDLRIPRGVGLAVLAGCLAVGGLLGTQVAPLLYPPTLVSRAVFHAVYFGGLGAVGALVFVAVGFDTFVSRAGVCRSLCPGGALFSLLSKLSPVRISRHAPDCTDCTVCDVVCNLGQRPMTDQLDSGCERCGKCVSACPTGALSVKLLASREEKR